MRDSFYFPAGRTSVGGWKPSALEFPAHQDPPPMARRKVLIQFGLYFLPLKFLIGWMVRAAEFGGHDWPLLVWHGFHLLFIACFCVHTCYRFTLMHPWKRIAALVLSLGVGIPVSYVLPWYSGLICLAVPRTCWRMIVSWLLYPDVHCPGLFRSPIRPVILRTVLSFSCEFPNALIAMLFALPLLETDDDKALQLG